MASLKGDLKKLKRGEFAGAAATVFCGIVLIYFIVCFSVARTMELKTLQLVTLITAPVLMVAGIIISAYCNLVYGKALDRAIKNYVLDVCVENAPLFRPEKNSLTFYVEAEDNKVNLQVNGYKEKIIFDFSALGRLSLSRKLYLLTAVEDRLCITFCRLYERGASYTDVSYAERAGTRKKTKNYFIIQNGKPNVTAYKYYLKNK